MTETFKGRKVIVIGLARSGIAAAEKLKESGAEVLAVDSNDNEELQKTAAELALKKIATRLGPHRLSDLDGRDLVIVSPGVPKSSPVLIEAYRRNLAVWSEIELASQFIVNPVIGVSGTNGKTTVTTLIGELLRAGNKEVVVSGNIGYPLTASLKDGMPEIIYVVELSSFQLENIESFHPWAAVLLNITEDHLDWHPDFADYIRAKTRLFDNQTEDDYAILNLDDQVVRSLVDKVKAHLVPTSKFSRQDGGLYLENGWIVSEFKGKENIVQIADLKIKGEHNIDNVMASIAAAQIAGVPVETIRKVLAGFRGLKHRIQFVAEINGVSFYNDSKATNPDATTKALTAFIQPIILLAGGRNKKNNFTGLAREIEKKVKAVVLFGEAAEEIRSALSDEKVEIIQVATLPEAVEEAAKAASTGDVVLLSPACASFDQFRDYEERGNVFITSVERLKGVKLES